MGIIDNLMNVMRLNPEDEDDDYMDEDFDEEEPEEKKPRKGLFSRKQKEEAYDDEPEPAPGAGENSSRFLPALYGKDYLDLSSEERKLSRYGSMCI